MSSIVTLGLGRLEVDWGKGWSSTNYSRLYLPSDKKEFSHYYADYFDGEFTGTIFELVKPGFSRSLRSVKRRLELLGYTMAEARRHYDEELKKAYPSFYCNPDVSFDMFARVLAAVDTQKVTLDPFLEDHSPGDFAARSILRDPEFTKTAANLESVSRYDGEFFENLDPYVILRLLAENPTNLDLDVQWRFADIVDGGWIDEASLYESLTGADRYLIVTEGSSDGAIIRRAIELLRPDVADFFDFVDMSENYPFTGTGNLFRFCQGLAQIKIQNRVVIVVDNDAAGLEAEERVAGLPLPRTMRVVRLPDLEECRRFPTVGPSGEAEEDINGRAVSIELFLDLDGTDEKPRVRWTSYNQKTASYQGELVGKERFTRRFFDARDLHRGYDMSKLERLVDHLCDEIVKAGLPPNRS